MGAVDAAGGGMAGIAGGMAPQLASSLVGILGATGQGAQSQVGNEPSPRPDAGTALAAAGASLAQATGSLFPMGGVLNTTVGLMRNDSVGMAHTMQIGTSQVLNVGSTSYEQVGQAKKLLGVRLAYTYDKTDKLTSMIRRGGERALSFAGGLTVKTACPWVSRVSSADPPAVQAVVCN